MGSLIVNMVELFNQYSDKALLVSGTYDQQILNFASGKYALVTQGSWIGATMTRILTRQPVTLSAE